MKELILELNKCLKYNLFITGLNTALIIPDICGAMESSDGLATGAKYKAWFDKYVAAKYGGRLSGQDVYKVRCASLHQGTFNKNYDEFDKIIFQLPSPLGGAHNVLIDDALVLQVEYFIRDIVEGLKEWESNMQGNLIYEENYKNSIKYLPNGLKGYIGGFPVIT